MRNCSNCRRKCESRGIAFKDMTIYCVERCPLEIQAECKAIATPDFRKVIADLKAGNFEMRGIKGILQQAECILNAADDIRA